MHSLGIISEQSEQKQASPTDFWQALLERFEQQSSKALTSRKDKALKHRTPSALKAELGDLLKLEGGSEQMEQLWEAFDRTVEFSVDTQSPYFMNQLFSSTHLPSLMGEMLKTLLNNSTYTYEMAPVASLMEEEVIRFALSYFGLKTGEGEGQILEGGSQGNLYALLMCKSQFLPEAKKKGLAFYGDRRFLFYISEEAHYSYAKAMSLAGFGEEALRLVPVDKAGRMSAARLEQMILEDINVQRGIPLFVGATAGTTVYGAFDPLEEIAVIVSKNQLWMHVDGAFGGGIFLSPRLREKYLKGLELADSFSFDTHKSMGVHLLSTVFICRHRGLLKRTFSTDRSQYLFHEEEELELQQYNRGAESINCGRAASVFKLWFTLKYFGAEGLEKRFDKLFSLAAHGEQRVRLEKANLTLVVKRESLCLCFYIGREGEPKELTNERTLKLRKRLFEKGELLVNYSKQKGRIFIRMVFLNPSLSYKDVDDIFDKILKNVEEQ